MFPYKDTQLATFLALVQTSNPGLQVQLTANDLRTLVPTAITADAFGRNTSVRLIAKKASQNAFGSQTVTYRRLDLPSYFRSMTPVPLNTYTSNTTLSAAEFCTGFQARYGVPLVTTDFSNTSFTSGSTTTLNLTGTSLCYVGALQVIWTKAKASLSDLLTGKTLVGKVYPGGNSFPGNRKPQGEYLFYGLDCSLVSANLKAATNGVVSTALWGSDSNYSAILKFLQGKRADLNLSSADSATTGGLGGLTVTRYALPSVSVPDANSDSYAYCTVIQSLSTSWYQGRILLHYN